MSPYLFNANISRAGVFSSSVFIMRGSSNSGHFSGSHVESLYGVRPEFLLINDKFIGNYSRIN